MWCAHVIQAQLFDYPVNIALIHHVRERLFLRVRA